MIASLPPAYGQGDSFVFANPRTSYVLNLTASGTDVIDRSSGTHMLVPFGAPMTFSGTVKYSKNSVYLVHNVRSHADAASDWNSLADLPVDFVRARVFYNWPGSYWGGPFLPFTSTYHFPDRSDKAITGYIASMYFAALGFDPAFDPAWDADGDGIIDPNVTNLPSYADPKVFDPSWKAYIAAYWTDSWKQLIQKKIDLAATENFDGITFDYDGNFYSLWLKAYPSMDLQTLRQQYVEFIKWASSYAKTTYGTAFLITMNLQPDLKDYFPDLGHYVDAGFYQNAFFSWTGSGAVSGFGLSVTADHFSNPFIDFLKSQDMAVLDMDQIGTGTVWSGLSWTDYDDQITVPNLLKLFKWAIQSGSTPYSSTVMLGSVPYGMFPRFVRVLPGLPSMTKSDQSTWVIGSAGDDTIITGDGNNIIYGGPGNDTIVGGAGSNTAYYLGPRSNFTVTQSNGKVIVADVTGAEGTDTLTNIQWLQFADQLVAIASGGEPNYGGLWWTAPAGAESGWGINFAHQGGIIFATWFTYDPTGKTLWLSMAARKTAPATYSGTLYQTSGPAFSAVAFYSAQVAHTPVGTATLSFTDGSNGTFAYTVNGIAQTKSITRQVFGPLPACATASSTSLSAATNYHDLWWAAPAGQESGWGINLSHQGDIIFATWFTYDTDHTPLWLSVTAPKTAPGVYSGTLYRTTGPAFSAVPFNPNNVTRTAVGTATFTFSDGNNASFASTVNGITQTKAITRQVFVSPGTVCQ